MPHRLLALLFVSCASQVGHGSRVRSFAKKLQTLLDDSEAAGHSKKSISMMLPHEGSAPAFHAPGYLPVSSAVRKQTSSTRARPQMGIATLPKIKHPRTQMHARPRMGRGLATPPSIRLLPPKSLKPYSSAQASTAAQLTKTLEARKADPQTSSELLSRFTRLFCGHFDNFNQFLDDKLAGREPMQGGGHEHIHCHLQQLPAATMRRASDPPDTEYVYANYYFNGQPDKKFRERVYVLQPREADEQFGMCIQMSIRRIRPETVDALNDVGGDASRVSWTEADVDDSLSIPNSDLFWRWQHGLRETASDGFDGRMRSESVVVRSPIRNKDIIVKDDLALLEGDANGNGDAVWCNDRGSDTDGNHIFGNIHDIPYKMQRVAPDDWTVTGISPE